MIVYGASVSPFVRKVVVVAAEKAMPITLRQIGLGATDPEFLAASPFRKMPGFSDGDFHISDSSAIVQYLEAIQPAPAMIPAEARARARTIWFDEFADTILTVAAGKMFFNRIVSPRFLGQPGDEAAAANAEASELPPILAYIEGVLPTSGHLVDDRMTLADISVASPFVNLLHCGYSPDAAKYPRLTAFLAMMFARPGFARTIAAEQRALAG